MRKLIHSLLSFFFPSFCLHCEERCGKPRQRLCTACFQAIDWVDEKQCCHACAKPLEKEGTCFCLSCREKPFFIKPHHSLFPAHPAILALFSDFQRSRHPQSCKTLASLFVLKLHHLPWPTFDVIVPFPKSRLDTFLLKKQESFLLARALAKMLGCVFMPILRPVQRGENCYIKVAEKTFGLKKNRGNIVDRKVLLLVDQLESSESLYNGRNILRSLFPKSIYSLALIDRRDLCGN